MFEVTTRTCVINGLAACVVLTGLAMLAGGCAAENTPQPEVTVTVTERPSPAADISHTPEASQSETGPWDDPLLIVDGRWRVGEDEDIPPGGLIFTPSEVSRCEWRVTDRSGTVVEEAIVQSRSGAFVALQDGDLFESFRCYVWLFLDDRPAKSGMDESKHKGASILPGTYIVGENAHAGRYYKIGPVEPEGKCGFSVKRDNGIRILEMASFESSNMGARSFNFGPVILEDGDIFETTCGAWTRAK